MTAPYLVTDLADPTGLILVEIRDYLAASGWDGSTRPVATVRGAQPGMTPAGATATADKPPLVVLARNGGAPARRVPIQTVRYIATCTGRNTADGPAEATALAGAVVAAVHDRGPRRSGRRAIYISAVISHANASLAPDTKLPQEQVVITVVSPSTLLPEV